jgi:hypothetical protein
MTLTVNFTLSGLSRSFNYVDVVGRGGSWEGGKVITKLPCNFPSGTYSVSITVVGKETNTVLMAIPPTTAVCNNTYIPFVGK